MKITPLDIQQQQFGRRFRGYDIEEVDTFLDMVAGELEELMQECKRLQEELEKQERRLTEYQASEEDFKKALIAAQQMREDMIAGAKRDAELISREAKLKAREAVAQGEREMTALQERLIELRRQRRQFEVNLRAVVNAHLDLLRVARTEEEPQVPAASVGERLAQRAGEGGGEDERAGRQESVAAAPPGGQEGGDAQG